MKLLCLVTLIACAVVQSALVPDVASLRGITKSLKRTEYGLKIVAPESERTKEVVDSEVEARIVEKFQEDGVFSRAIDGLVDQLQDPNTRSIIDPLFVEQIGPFEYSALTYSSLITILGLKVEGLSTFALDRLHLNPEHLTAGIAFAIPAVTLTGSYEASSRVGLVTMRGQGDFNIVAERCRVSFYMNTGVNAGEGHLYLEELDIHIGIEDIKITVFNQEGSSAVNTFITSAIENTSQLLIQTQLPLVSRFLSSAGFYFINGVFRQFSL